MRCYLETEGGRVAVLCFFTLIGVGFYVWTRDKFIVEIFAGPLLLAMNVTGKKSDES